MPKKTDGAVVHRTYQLSQLGLRQSEVENRLYEEFDSELIPDQSTISRHIRKFAQLPPDELAEDAPFAWGEMSTVPWETSRLILDVWATLMEKRSYARPLSKREMKWTWRVLKAMDINSLTDIVVPETPEELWSPKGPSILEIHQIAQEYSWREIAAVVRGERFNTFDLDMLMALTPWKNADCLGRYIEAKEQAERFDWVRWHRYDTEWLDSVSPEVAPRIRAFSPYRLDPRYLAGTDGLLFHQIAGYLVGAFDDWGDEPRPWHVEYLEHTINPELLREIKAQIRVS